MARNWCFWTFCLKNISGRLLKRGRLLQEIRYERYNNLKNSLFFSFFSFKAKNKTDLPIQQIWNKLTWFTDYLSLNKSKAFFKFGAPIIFLLITAWNYIFLSLYMLLFISAHSQV